ncbi:MAG: hypothetical protein M4579_004260 [Chaenotheca gracillima]|nr:MAG: hypothetical protein M4579_004260 [Chaenotheca gracillima]
MAVPTEPERLFDLQEQDQPRKRQRLDAQTNRDETSASGKGEAMAQLNPAPAMNAFDESRKEQESGITEFISSSSFRFSGLYKKRYTDFLVNEILPSGQVLHLEPPSAPARDATRDEKQTEPSKPAEEVNTRSLEGVEEKLSRRTAAPEAVAANSDVAKDGLHTATKVATSEPVEAAPPPFEISDEDKATIESLLGAKTYAEISDLHSKILKAPNAKARDQGTVQSQVLEDRSQRTDIHKLIRRVFSSRLESTTGDDGSIVFSAAAGGTGGWGPKSQQRGKKENEIKGKVGWQEQHGGEYLHFTIHKENKDTMEVVAFIARELKSKPKSFQFAGTKDRRAVTVQRASAYRLTTSKLLSVGKKLRGSVVGGFEHKSKGLDLGDLAGNEFLITLRDCVFNDSVDATSQRATYNSVLEGLQGWRQNGFINYFGLQRFGTFATRTDVIGRKMLQGDFKAACELILSYPPETLAAADGKPTDSKSMISYDDKARAKAINIFEKTGRTNPSMSQLPKKFSAEAALIRHLGGQSKGNDFQGALGDIPRNLRTMYVHAYQSRVWNMAAGERLKRFGAELIPGDLVLVKEHKEKAEGPPTTGDNVDEGGEVVVQPSADDSAIPQDEMFERARALTAEEASSGKYNIFDIVLPTPGFDILYPDNTMADFYTEWMGSEEGGGLDPHNMRRAWRDISLSGSYRKVLARPIPTGPLTARVLRYEEDDVQMVLTDLEKIQGKSNVFAEMDGTGENEQEARDFAKAAESDTSKVAVILSLQLAPSQYATMALRELLGPGGLHAWKPDFGGGR